MESIKNAASSAVNTASSYIYGNANEAASGTEPASGQEAGNTSTEPKPAESTGSSGANFGSSTDPSTGADPSSGQQPEAKHQGADRPKEAPDGEQTEAVKESKDEGEEAIKKRDPNDHSGEPMHMHGGAEDKQDETLEDKDHPGQEGGDEHGNDKGSGEKWVKTSGLQADGGDFDAAQAGAGREADRLLGEKGIHKDGRGAMLDKDDNPVTGLSESDHKDSSGHSKPKTLDKIKEKLHIGSKH